MRLIVRAALLGAACLTIAGTSVASADARSRAYMIISADGRCLDADVSTPTHDGTRVQVWRCNRKLNQQWYFDTDGTLRSAHDGRCVDADISTPTHDGTRIQLWHCISGNRNQIWFLGGGTIYSYYDGRCLDRDVSVPFANGGKVQLWHCNGWINQQWRLEEI